MSFVDQPDDLSDFGEMFARGADGPPPEDPAAAALSRQRRRRRRITAAIITVVVLAAIGTYIPVVLAAPVAAAAVTLDKADVAQPIAVALALPKVGASALSVTGADGFAALVGTDELRASSGGTGPLPIASISKLITALVVLDAKPLGLTDAGPNITFSKADSKLYDKYYVLQASIEPMKSGSVMSEHDALATILVASACNYAEAISTWAFGSQANFLVAARKWLASHALSGTRMVEPTGVNARNVSTPTDLIGIGKLAMANPLVASIVGLTTYSVPTIGTIQNTNDVLGIDGINGIKTGTLETSDLLFSAIVDVGAPSPVTVVGAILGGESRGSVDAAARALIASIKSGFHLVLLTDRGQMLGSYSTQWGEKGTVVAGESASVFTWSDTPIAASTSAASASASASGAKVGSVTFVAGKSTVTVPLVIKGAIKGPGAWWRLTHPFEMLGASTNR